VVVGSPQPNHLTANELIDHLQNTSFPRRPNIMNTANQSSVTPANSQTPLTQASEATTSPSPWTFMALGTLGFAVGQLLFDLAFGDQAKHMTVGKWAILGVCACFGVFGHSLVGWLRGGAVQIRLQPLNTLFQRLVGGSSGVAAGVVILIVLEVARGRLESNAGEFLGLLAVSCASAGLITLAWVYGAQAKPGRATVAGAFAGLAFGFLINITILLVNRGDFTYLTPYLEWSLDGVPDGTQGIRFSVLAVVLEQMRQSLIWMTFGLGGGLAFDLGFKRPRLALLLVPLLIYGSFIVGLSMVMGVNETVIVDWESWLSDVFRLAGWLGVLSLHDKLPQIICKSTPLRHLLIPKRLAIACAAVIISAAALFGWPYHSFKGVADEISSSIKANPTNSPPAAVAVPTNHP
jgi:hypothetical protein